MTPDSTSAFNAAAIASWLTDHIGAAPPMTFAQVAGGKSNVTFLVTDATGRRVILRRPPFGHLLASAHDVGREYRIMSALTGTPVPVPAQLAWCGDQTISDAPFLVMAFVEGAVVRTASDAGVRLPVADRVRASEALVDTLVAIHRVDVDAVGLGDLARRSGYVARQLKRWRGQFEQSCEVTGGPLRLAIEVHDHLVAAMPEDRRATLVHGDYRIDNVLLGPGGSVAAVLDWELATLGDPLVDIGTLLVYWAEPDGAEDVLGGISATTGEGFPGRDWVAARYAEATGVELGALDFYLALANWKLACILDGVNARVARGVMGNAPDDLAVGGDSVEQLFLRARRAVRSL